MKKFIHTFLAVSLLACAPVLAQSAKETVLHSEISSAKLSGWDVSVALMESENIGIIGGDTLNNFSQAEDKYYPAYVTVKNVGANTLKLRVRMDTTDKATAHKSQFCFGEACYGWQTLESDEESGGIITLAPGATDKTLKAEINPEGNNGKSTIHYTIFNHADPFDNVSISLVWNFGVTSVENEIISNTSLSQPAPNPASSHSRLAFTLPNQATSAFIVVNNSQGNEVHREELTAKEGTVQVNTSALSQGSYPYALYVNNVVVKRGVIVVVR